MVFEELGAIPYSARHASLYDFTIPLTTACHRTLSFDPGCPAILIYTVDLGRCHRTVVVFIRCAKNNTSMVRHRALLPVQVAQAIFVGLDDVAQWNVSPSIGLVVGNGPQFLNNID